MDVFNLDRALLSDYQHFTRSFTIIRSADIRDQIDGIYGSGKLWPDPLISINPHYERGARVDELVADGSLHANSGLIFRVDGHPITFHRHQAQALTKAKARQSFVVTTGTGSGKSLCFFVPIVDAAVRARAAGEAPRTRAIIVYPMNALANSQMKELEKFLAQSGLTDDLCPTFARYTGQEDGEERDRIRRQKPDILLTNFMMLELLITRQNELDRNVIENAIGLDFIVLDELHTYRGRQGADVAMLMRRLRDRLCAERDPVCIGTSATMANEGDEGSQAQAVAGVASRLFGTVIHPNAVIAESLVRATDPLLVGAKLGQSLLDVVNADLPKTLADADLKKHPLAIWIETEIGLKEGQRLSRRLPCTVADAASRLHAQTGLEEAHCRGQIEAMLMLMGRPANERGGAGDRAFLAFKLHRFLSGASHVYSTLRERGSRRVTLDGQRFYPTDTEARLYPTYFCRACGQEHHSVTFETSEDGRRYVMPRPIDETPLEDGEDEIDAGYLMPVPKDDEEFRFSGEVQDYPEDWQEVGKAGPRLKSDKRDFQLQELEVDHAGMIGGVGVKAWFIPGRFRFCPACGYQPPVQAREINKLASLSAEGRSSATTLLVSSVLRWMHEDAHGIATDKRKLLAFTDNRQDAALQAGHFNDFLFVSLLRAGILAAVRGAGAQGLSDDEFGRRVQSALGFVATREELRVEWMADPGTKGVGRIDAEKALARVLKHRVWEDQRRGWRFTNPNLEDLGLVSTQYVGIDELLNDEEAFAEAPASVRGLSAEKRRKVLIEILEVMRKGLAVNTDALNPAEVDILSDRSRQYLREPWAISAQEKPRVAAALMVDAPNRADTGIKGEVLVVRAGERSALGKAINKPAIWGERLKAEDYRAAINGIIAAAQTYGLVQSVATPFDTTGWLLSAAAVRLVPGAGREDGRRVNPYFVALYETLAEDLAKGGQLLFGLEGREHTAQVDAKRREWRECRFRWGEEDKLKLTADKEDLRQAGEGATFLPALFCSPTMELGVDISALNAVYMRNVPPTPANYAQRAGRAGRSGQAALAVTYCAAQSPHDQYYFGRPNAMVQGIVKPPALELANRDLIEAHLHAVWLAETGKELTPDIPGVLDIAAGDQPVRDDLWVVLTAPAVTARARTAMRRIVDRVATDLTPEAAPWAIDRDAFVAEVADKSAASFSAAFQRWRDLDQAARFQLQEANKRSEQFGLTKEERREAKSQQAQANEQINLLERGTSGMGSDFYTYRYLATEGFLPGYNFPRLPLYAFIPGVGPGAQSTFLQRARFLAISEFGPGSLIYHEGRAFRVTRAKLPPGAQSEDGGRLGTTTVYICGECGASHAPEQPETCHACKSSMSDVHPVRNVLRIDNVETRAAERITANDEERQRRGFEIQTVFEWPRRNDHVDVVSAVGRDAEGDVVHVDFAFGATISRLNKGLRRRKDKAILGFGIDPSTGRWGSGDPDNPSEDPEKPTPQRVVPIVRDNKNAALVRFADVTLGDTAMATVQHALARGIGLVYQLEDGEVMTEPVPSRDRRKAILSFEATEGGAGVLGRLAIEKDALAKVARTALELMHYKKVDEAAADLDPSILESDASVPCVRGCYRCLLSYYNQPDHELIDRTDREALTVLLRMVRCETVSSSTLPGSGGGGSGDPWIVAVRDWGLPIPDPAPLRIGDRELPLHWPAHLVAACSGPIETGLAAAAEALGYNVVALPEKPGETAPSELASLLGGATT